VSDGGDGADANLGPPPTDANLGLPPTDTNLGPPPTDTTSHEGSASSPVRALALAPLLYSLLVC
jgi:hypothetical protein